MFYNGNRFRRIKGIHALPGLRKNIWDIKNIIMTYVRNVKYLNINRPDSTYISQADRHHTHTYAGTKPDFQTHV